MPLRYVRCWQIQIPQEQHPRSSIVPFNMNRDPFLEQHIPRFPQKAIWGLKFAHPAGRVNLGIDLYIVWGSFTGFHHGKAAAVQATLHRSHPNSRGLSQLGLLAPPLLESSYMEPYSMALYNYTPVVEVRMLTAVAS